MYLYAASIYFVLTLIWPLFKCGFNWRKSRDHRDDKDEVTVAGKKHHVWFAPKMPVKSRVNAILHAFGRKKTVDTTAAALDTKLRRCLTSVDLTLIGIGSTLGSGVYVLTGDIARTTAGPGIVLSFFIAGFASILAGICYAEFGARVPKAGSAYTYTYVTVGELSGFVVGWNLLLEYGIGSATVTKGLSTYLDAAVDHKISDYIIRKTGEFSMFGDETYLDFVAFSLSILFTIFISLGVKYTSFLNNICTFSNILVIVMVTAMGAFYCDFSNWHDFAPFGVRGIVKGASSCFFAFIGFDVIATSGEEAKKPSRSVPIAIIGTITICFLAYFGVAAVVTMMVPYNHLDGDAALSKAFDNRNNVAKYIVSAGALLGLTGTMIVSLVPMPRLLYSMAKDGLVFRFLGQVNSRTDVPVIATVVTGILTAVMSLLVKLHDLVEMVSIGTLLAYTFVVVSVLLLRYHPMEIGMGKGSLSRAITPTSLNVSMPDAVDPFQHYTDDNAERVAKPYPSSSMEKSNSSCKLPTDKSYKTVAICLLLGIIEILAFCVIITFLPEELESRNIFVIILLVVLLLALLFSMILIWKQPENKQALFFKTPLVPWLPFLSLFFNIYLMVSLRKLTWLRFAIWMVVGFAIYFGYGIFHSVERNRECYEAVSDIEHEID